MRSQKLIIPHPNNIGQSGTSDRPDNILVRILGFVIIVLGTKISILRKIILTSLTRNK